MADHTNNDEPDNPALHARASRPATIRSQNERLVLDVLRHKGKATRAELADATSLTLPAISSICQGLSDEGLVVEHRDPKLGGGRGRPPVVVEFLPASRFVIAISLNRVATQIVLADALGAVHAERIIDKFDDVTPATVIAYLRRVITLLMADANVAADQINAIGLAVGGVVDSDTGMVHSAPRLGWTDTPLRTLLAKDIEPILGDIPIHVIDAGRAVAVAEATEGKAKGLRNVVVIDVGATVSSAIIQNGRIINGASGYAGHLGACQIPIIDPSLSYGDPEPPRRTIDYYASTQGMFERYIEARPDRAELESVRTVFDAIADGDPDAINIIIECGTYIALGISWVVNFLDPDHIVLTGALATVNETYQDAITALIADRLSADQFDRLAISYSDTGTTGWLRGAVMAALQENSIALEHLFDRATIA